MLICRDLAGATGLEPATSGVTGRRSNQLNYAPGAQGSVAAGRTRPGVTALDWILLGLVALTALGGLGTGLVTTLFTLAGLVAGAVVGAGLAPEVLSGGAESTYTGLVGIGGGILGAAILCVLARWLGSFVRGGLRLVPPLRAVDSLGGAVLGAFFGIVLVWVGAAVAMQLPDHPEVRREVRQSEVVRQLNQIASPDGLLNIQHRLNGHPTARGG
jgi:Colicin V production protein